jgi:hypothetical protein
VRVISEDRFDATYDGLPAADGSSLWGWDDARVLPVERVWTVVDGDDGGLWAMPGFHVVNCVGYLVTTRPHGFADVTVRLD